jgi:sRNA-binding protein
MRLWKLSPALFTARAVPLAIGINDEIVCRLELTDVQDLRALGAILHQTVTRHGSLRALGTEGGMRFDLDGNAVEPVNDEHRERAQASLAKLARKAKAKRQAEKQMKE